MMFRLPRGGAGRETAGLYCYTDAAWRGRTVMSAVTSVAQPGASQQAVVEAALVLLERIGPSPADLMDAPWDRP